MIIGIIGVVSVLISGVIRIGYPRFGAVQRRLDRLNAVAREFLASVRVVKAFNAEEQEAEKFDVASHSLASANTAALRVMATFMPLINLTVNFGIVLLLDIPKSGTRANRPVDGFGQLHDPNPVRRYHDFQRDQQRCAGYRFGAAD